MKIFDPKSPTNINPWFLLFIVLFVAVTLHVRSKDPTYLGGLSATASAVSSPPAEENLAPAIGIYNLPVGRYYVVEAKDDGPTTPGGMVHKYTYTVIDASKLKEKRKIWVTCEQPIIIQPMSKAGDTWKIDGPGQVEVESGVPGI